MSLASAVGFAIDICTRATVLTRVSKAGISIYDTMSNTISQKQIINNIFAAKRSTLLKS
jgi:hypothetical protein